MLDSEVLVFAELVTERIRPFKIRPTPRPVVIAVLCEPPRLESRGAPLTLRIKLPERASRVSKKIKKFFRQSPALTFRDICWNRSYSPANLACQSVDFSFRKTISSPIHVYNQIHSLLPHDQISVTSYRRLSRSVSLCHLVSSIEHLASSYRKTIWCSFDPILIAL